MCSGKTDWVHDVPTYLSECTKIDLVQQHVSMLHHLIIGGSYLYLQLAIPCLKRQINFESSKMNI